MRRANWCFLLAVVSYIGGSLLLGRIARHVELPYFLSIMSGQILIALSLVISALIFKGKAFGVIRRERLGIVDILLIICIMFLCLPLVYFINAISMLFTENAMAGTMVEMMDMPYLLNLFMVAVSPAVVEELLCRGVLHHNYRTKNVLFGVILNSVIFGLLHLNINQMLYAMALGIIFSLVVEATGSIYSSMIMHFIMNSISVTLVELMKIIANVEIYAEELATTAVAAEGAATTTDMAAATEAAEAMVMEIPAGLSVILYVIGFLIAFASTTCAIALIFKLAKRRGHYEEFKAIFRIKKKAAVVDSGEDEKENVEGVVDKDVAEKRNFMYYVKDYAALVVAAGICITFMVLIML